MKKIISSLCMLILALALVVVGNYYLKSFQAADSAVKRDMLIAGDICEVDKDMLEFYGISNFSSNLPIIEIDTDDQQIIKEEARFARVGIIDGSDDGSSIDDSFDASLYCSVKLRGASSYAVFDKPQYRITFYRNADHDKMNYPLCGMTASSEWVLNGPFLDQTMMRNSLVYNLAHSFELWSPDAAYAELFVNGDYMGLYLVLEPVNAEAGRLELSDYSLASGQTAYIVRRDRSGTEDNPISTFGAQMGYTNNELSISYPTATNLINRQRKWIISDISAFEEALYSEYFADSTVGYAKHIDTDSFVDYYLLNEAVLNHDAGSLSTFCYKDLGGKLRMAVWDYNDSFDNYQWFSMNPESFHLQGATWFNRLLQDRAFVEKLCARYHELRETVLATDALYQYIDETELLISDAAYRNDKVWGYSFDIKMLVNGSDAERNPTTRAEAVQQLKDTIDRRLSFLDEHIEDLYDNCVN